MKFTTASILACLLLPPASAFTPSKTPVLARVDLASRSTVSADQDRMLFDPLGLYPSDSPERTEGRLQPLESASSSQKTVKDPMGIYVNNNAEVDDLPMSKSLPFLQRPAMLDGSLPGDRGFDPFNLSADAAALQWYRTAEAKHARLAMLAAVGWPMAELFHKNFASLFNLKPLLVFQDRVPSVLNGGLDRTPAAYWAAALGVAFAIETLGLLREQSAADKSAAYTPGDLGFDPLNLAGSTTTERKYKAEAELFNGRLAMLGITGYAVQEWWTQNSVIHETPFFFRPITVVWEQLQDAVGNAGL
jgi:hypothetical protein